MKRRVFIALVCSAILTGLSPAHSQKSAKVHRVAFIAARAPIAELISGANPVARHFADGLRALGYVEPQLVVEWRSAEGKFERLPEIIAELLALKVDVIVTVTNPMTRIAKKMASTVPIVMALSTNPVEEGLIESFARPGGNVTGLASSAGDAELLAKRVQLLKELLPGMSRVAFLQSEEESVAGQELRAFKTASEALGVQVLLVEHKPSEYAEAFARIVREQTDALLPASSAANYANRHLIVQFAAKSRLPTMFGGRDHVEIGGLISYMVTTPKTVSDGQLSTSIGFSRVQNQRIYQSSARPSSH
jgi:putative ABC transport system substrate-binding protein